MNRTTIEIRGLWLAVIMLAAALVGITTGLLAYLLGGVTPLASLGMAGTAFAGVATLGMAAWKFVAG